MTDNAPASSMLNEPAAPAAPAPGQPAAAPAAAPAAPAAGNGSTIDWVREWDAADAGVVEKKGWQTPKDLFKSYRELETKMGQDKIVLPKDGADPKEWDAVYARLGRPDSPDKYAMPQGSDEGMFKAIAPKLHAAGLSQKQLDSITAGYNEYAQSLVDRAQTELKADFKAAEDQLTKEWGVTAPKELEIERRTMRALGIDIGAVERAVQGMGKGGAMMMHRLLNIAGRAITEDQGADITGDESLGFAGTPNRAAAELQELKGNKDFMQRYASGDIAAKAKYNRLIKQIAEGGRVKTTINKPY